MDKILDRGTSAVVPFGALSGIRTLDLLIKSQLLLPAELRAHISGYYGRPRRVERLDFHYWSWRQESNLQPADYKSAALPLSHASMLRTFAISTPSGLLLIAT